MEKRKDKGRSVKEKPVKVSKQAFDKVLGKLLGTPPIKRNIKKKS